MAAVRSRARVLTTLLMLMWCGSAPFAADPIYKWRDARGHVHYGDHAPANTAITSEHVQTAPRSRPDSDAEQRRTLRRRLLESFAHDRAAKHSEQAKREATRAHNEAACSRIRSRLAALQRAGSVFQTKADGQRVYFTDAQRARILHDTRNTIREHCD